SHRASQFRLTFFITGATTCTCATLSLHDALPIYPASRIAWILFISALPYVGALAYLMLGEVRPERVAGRPARLTRAPVAASASPDRKSTRLNSSHVKSSYAVFCLKKKMHT